MKNKFLILTLCFTIVFSSLNINRSHADGGVLSLPVLGVVTSLAVGTGIAINNSDDLYDLGYMFVDYIKQKNQDISTVLNVFNECVRVSSNMVKVDAPFLDIVKDFFDTTFTSSTDKILGGLSSLEGSIITGLNPNKYIYLSDDVRFYFSKVTNNLSMQYNALSYALQMLDGSTWLNRYTGSIRISEGDSYSEWTDSDSLVLKKYVLNGINYLGASSHLSYDYTKRKGIDIDYFNNYITNDWGYDIGVFEFPYSGGYDWNNAESKKETDDSLTLPIPNNLGNLVGQNSTDFWDNSSSLVGGGSLGIPNVDSPSIELGGATTFPNAGTSDTPSDTPSTGVIDWITSLVVPSSAYWADTFDTFFTNIGNAFPMVDISRFKDLCINGVPPKDIEVTIMGAKGKIFDTKYLNSIVDWLQPIVSAFMAFLLMLYNYRKVYKLIRGFEPFGGIADGNSVGDVRGKMDGAMPEMGGSSFVGPSTASTWSDGQSITRGSIQSRYYGRDL